MSKNLGKYCSALLSANLYFSKLNFSSTFKESFNPTVFVVYFEMGLSQCYRKNTSIKPYGVRLIR